MRAAVLALVAALPTAALASGFYVPWWGEALLFLLLTPWGWAATAATGALLGYAAYRMLRK